MKPTNRSGRFAKLLTSGALVAIHAIPANALELADQPLFLGGAKPNVLFVLDDSSSMLLSYLPRKGQLGHPAIDTSAFKNHHCNPLYFDPNADYPPPKMLDANGKALEMPNADFNAARSEGFDPKSTIVNLAGQFQSYDYLSSDDGDVDPPNKKNILFPKPPEQPQGAYYYAYKGNGKPSGNLCITSYDVPPNDDMAQQRDRYGRGLAPAETENFVRISIAAFGPEMRQKFANWYSYYRTRILATKTAASRAFATIDDSYRVGFHTINASTNPATIGQVGDVKHAAKWLPVDTFDIKQRKDFYATLAAQVPKGDTPLRLALARAGRYFAGKKDGPNEGLGESPITASCQANFTILHTDGYWNSHPGVDLDGKEIDGDLDGGASVARPFRDTLKSHGTLADVALYYYENDLRPDLDDKVPARGTGPEDDSNPKQHMTTFTIGFGVDGLLEFDPDYRDTGGGDYGKLRAGTKNWPLMDPNNPSSKADDLWHAAVNGRGQAFLSSNPAELEQGIQNALNSLTASAATGAGAAASAFELLGNDNLAYTTRYVPAEWSGDLRAFKVAPSGLVVDPTPIWSAAAQLDARDFRTRRVLIADSRTGNAKSPTGLRDLHPGSFDSSEKEALFGKDKIKQLAQYQRMTSAQRDAAGAMR